MEIVRTALGSTCTAVAMLGNRCHPDKKSEQSWVHLDGKTEGWPAFDHKLVGRSIARGACDNFRYSTALDREIAEPDGLTKYLKCPLNIAVGLGATSEGNSWFGILAALRPFPTC